jgi:hypothetical protein
MQKRNNILNVFFLFIFINSFQKIFSDIAQFNSTELYTYNKLINNFVAINIGLKKYELKIEKIRLNWKLKSKYRDIKTKFEELEPKINQIKRKVNETLFNKNIINYEINSLSDEYDSLKEKFVKFVFKYNEYKKILDKILGYIKIFFFCFFTILIILIIILIIVSIYVYRRYKRNRYHTLIEEISVQQNIKRSTKFPNVDQEKSDRSENKNINEHDSIEKNEKIQVKA